MIQTGTLSHFTVRSTSYLASADAVTFVASDTIVVRANYSGANGATNTSWSANHL